MVAIAGLAVGLVGWRGLRGTLPRNRFVGVRTPMTLASDEAFRAGNRVAGPPLLAAGAVALLGGPAAAASPSTPAFAVVLLVVGLGVVGLSVAGGLLGSRAAATAGAAGAGAGAAGVDASKTSVPASRPLPCAGCACGGPGTSACAR